MSDVKSKQLSFAAESNLNSEIAQLLLSILHSWELDADLDNICSGKLGLLKPKWPPSFGLISREGHLSLLLPPSAKIFPGAPVTDPFAAYANFAKNIHWCLSSSLTTQHLLCVISVANTLMSTNNAGFLPDHEKKRKLLK